MQKVNKRWLQIKYPTVSETSSLEKVHEITITGTVSKLQSIVRAVENLKCNCVLRRCVLQCPKRFVTIWNKRWEKFSEIQRRTCVVIVEHTVDCTDLLTVSDTKEPTYVDIKFSIYGARSDVQSVKEKLLREENGEKTKIHVVTLSSLEFRTLEDNIVKLRKELEDSHFVYLSIRDRNAFFHYPINADINTTRVESKLKALIASVPTQSVKNVTVSDKQLADLLTCAWSTLIECTGSEVSVTMQNNSILIKGISENVHKIVERYLKILKTRLKTTRLSLPIKYTSIISSAQFPSCLSGIESEAGVRCYIPDPQTNEAVLEQTTLMVDDNSCTVQFCKGDILLEKVDAVIVPIVTQLAVSTCTTTVTKNIMEISGSNFKETYTDYLSHNKLIPGDAAEFACENLPFHTVIFMKVKPSNDLSLSQAVRKALELAYDSRLGSISLYVGIGLAADTLCSVVLDKVSRSSSHFSLHTIRIVTSESHATSEHPLISDVFLRHKQAAALLSAQAPHLQHLATASSQCSSNLRTKEHRWFWKDDSGVFIEYTRAVADQLTSKWLTDPIGTIKVVINRQIYRVTFQEMTQINSTSGTKRDIKHLLPSDHDVKKSSITSVQWSYQDDSGLFSPYEKEQSEEIEQMYRSQLHHPIKIGKWTYDFDFLAMRQINTRTKRERTVRRETQSEVQGSSNTKTEVDVYIGIRGIKHKIESACKLIVTKLESLLAMKKIDLPPRKTINKQKLKSISEEHMHVEIVQTGRSICISGDKASVNGALIDIQAEIIASQNHPESEPADWSPQARICELFEVTKSSSEWIKISSLFMATMSGYKITSIKRVQNQLLWKKYQLQKETVEKKNGGEANEKLLFHGSRKVSAEDIVDSDNGLDMRVSSKGMWGKANYFAEKAMYSDSYAYQYTQQFTSTTVKEMLVFKVITGASITLPPDQSLRMPPEKEASGTDVTLKKMRYDTVNGVTQSTQVYMTYDNYKSYPAYIITYHKESAHSQQLSSFRSSARVGLYGI